MDAESPAVENVPATAFLTALARAEAHPGELRDEFAERFAALCPGSIRRITRQTAGTSVVVARTVIIDRLLSELLVREQAEVCVNLGAGFDARPFRLAWPAGCRVVEVDSAAVLDVKDRLLPVGDAEAGIERARCDLRDLEALRRLLTPPTDGRRVVVLAEGLLTYLPQPDVSALASTLADLGSSVHWICDVVSAASARALSKAARAAATPLDMVGLEDLSAFEAAGWRCERLELLPTARLTTGTGSLPDSVLQLRLASRRR